MYDELKNALKVYISNHDSIKSQNIFFSLLKNTITKFVSKKVHPTIRTEVSDAIMESFLAKILPRIRSGELESNYLPKYLRNQTEWKCNDFIRKMKIERYSLIDLYDEDDNERPYFVSDVIYNPEKIYFEDFLKHEIKNIGRKMNPLDQKVSFLSYVENLKPSEVATTLGLTVNEIYQSKARIKYHYKKFLVQTRFSA